MKLHLIAGLLGTLIDLVDDLLLEMRTRMVATQLLQSVAATAAKYRAVRRNQSSPRFASKMCLVLEETDPDHLWWERVERKKLSRRLESVHQAIMVADEIIERTFTARKTGPAFPRYIRVPSTDFQPGPANGDGSSR